MLVKDPDGNVHKAHLLGKYGHVVLVVGGKSLGHFDVAGLELIEATDEERADLARAGFSFNQGNALLAQVSQHPPAGLPAGRRQGGGDGGTQVVFRSHVRGWLRNRSRFFVAGVV